MKFFLAIIALLWVQSTAGYCAERTLGWKSNPTHGKGQKQIATHPAFKAAPLPVSASVRAGMPPIYDQGSLGSCTAHAGAAAFDYAYSVAHKKFSTPSRLDLYQLELLHDGPAKTYLTLQDNGSYTDSVLFVLKNTGVIAPETKHRYFIESFNIAPPACAVKRRSSYATVKSYTVPNDDGGYAIKQAIANLKVPVMTGGYVYQGIFTPVKDAKTGRWIVPDPKGKPVGGHEVDIVSYDDSAQMAEIRNSWGKDYADKGYVWIRYSYIFNPKQWEDNGVIEVTK